MNKIFSFVKQEIKKISIKYCFLLMKDKKFLSSNLNYMQAFTSYKNKFNRVVLVGAGSSINKFQRIDDAVYIGVNRSFLSEKVRLDYLFAQDKFPEGMKEANNYKKGECKKFYGVIPYSTRYLQNFVLNTFGPDDEDVKEASATLYFLKPGFFHNIEQNLDKKPFGDLKGTVFTALQFALYAGAKEIYLVGCDCSSGHFYSDQKKLLNYQIKIWEQMKKIVSRKYPNVKIFSVNPVNLKGIFEDIYQSSEE